MVLRAFEMTASPLETFASWVESSDRRSALLPEPLADRRMHFGMLVMLSVLLVLAPCVQPGAEILWAVTLEDPSTDDDRTTLLTIDDFDQAGGVTTAACQNSIRVPGFSEILCPRLNFAKVIARGPPVAPSDTSSQNLCVQYHSQSDFYSNGRSPVHDLAFATVHAINLCGKQDPGKFYGAQDLKRTEHSERI